MTPDPRLTHCRIAAASYSEIPPRALVVLPLMLDGALLLIDYQLTAIGHKKVNGQKIGKLGT
jgi:hypothetical protein